MLAPAGDECSSTDLDASRAEIELVRPGLDRRDTLGLTILAVFLVGASSDGVVTLFSVGLLSAGLMLAAWALRRRNQGRRATVDRNGVEVHGLLGGRSAHYPWSQVRRVVLSPGHVHVVPDGRLGPGLDVAAPEAPSAAQDRFARALLHHARRHEIPIGTLPGAEEHWQLPAPPPTARALPPRRGSR